MPFFDGEKQVCPPLANLAGLEERMANRWQPLLNSGSRTGEELRAAWSKLQERARQMSSFTEEEELGGVLGQPVEAAGDGSTDGSSRMAITTQLETLTLAALRKHLDGVRDRKARPVCSMQQKDKLSTAWLLALPASPPPFSRRASPWWSASPLRPAKIALARRLGTAELTYGATRSNAKPCQEGAGQLDMIGQKQKS